MHRKSSRDRRLGMQDGHAASIIGHHSWSDGGQQEIDRQTQEVDK